MDFEFTFYDAPKLCVLRQDYLYTTALEKDVRQIKVKLFRGSLAEYSEVGENELEVYFENVVIRMTKKFFESLATPLSCPPNGLQYRTLDEAFMLEDEPFWICDIDSNTFVQASSFPRVINSMDSCIDISESYSREQYGVTWIVLTKA